MLRRHTQTRILPEGTPDIGGTLQRPAMRITGPALDAADPIGLARFYERLLGWEMVEIEGPRPGHPAMLDPAGHPFCLFATEF